MTLPRKPFDLRVAQGTRAIVTAGGAGIGRTIAETLDSHGATVHVCDVSDDALGTLGRERPEIFSKQVDVSDSMQVDQYFSDAVAALGGLDLLVNNAGIAGPTARVDEIDPSEWDRTVAVNLSGQFYCARSAVRHLRKSGSAAIINMASVAGRLGYAFRTPYAATKWGIIGLTQSLAKELGPEGIRVNAILPGIVEGQRMDGVIEARASAIGKSFEETRAMYLETISLRRMVSSQDVADMVLFLCSPAGRNISGQSLSVCGNVETL